MFALIVPLQALEKHLAPRLQLTGGMGDLQKFGEFINSQPLEKGVNICMFWRGSDNLEVVVKPDGSVDLAQVANVCRSCNFYEVECQASL